jgi:lipopolysaccharide exporter
VVEFRKSLDFAKEFRYSIFRRMSLFVFGIILALTLRSYLALAIASPVSAAVAVTFSYVMSRYRPRLCFTHVWAVWRSSRWFILQNFSQSALDRSDEFVIGGVANSVMVGNYFVADQVGPMPTRELAWPMERALMPVYAKIHGDAAALRGAVVNVLGTLGPVCICISVGMMLVADDFVAVVFGEHWRSAVPFLRWLAIYGVFAALARPFMPLFYMLRREYLYALLSFGQLLAMLGAVTYAARHLPLVDVAVARTLVAAVSFTVLAIVASRIAPVRLADFGRVLWRPVIAAAVMSCAVRGLQIAHGGVPALRLIRDAAAGSLVFMTAHLVLWWLAGRPEGVERMVLAMSRRFLAARGIWPTRASVPATAAGNPA